VAGAAESKSDNEDGDDPEEDDGEVTMARREVTDENDIISKTRK